VGDDSHGDHDAHSAASLEGRTDGEPVHDAMPNQPAGRKKPDRLRVGVIGVLSLVCTVDADRALDHVQRQETKHEGQHRRGHTKQPARFLRECLGNQVESDDAEHEPRCQPQHQMPVVANSQRRETSQQGGQKRSEGQENNHDRTSPLRSTLPLRPPAEMLPPPYVASGGQSASGCSAES
jgi:hypothetical protein